MRLINSVAKLTTHTTQTKASLKKLPLVKYVIPWGRWGNKYDGVTKYCRKVLNEINASSDLLPNVNPCIINEYCNIGNINTSYAKLFSAIITLFLFAGFVKGHLTNSFWFLKTLRQILIAVSLSLFSSSDCNFTSTEQRKIHWNYQDLFQKANR